jgi:hypothetical protein
MEFTYRVINEESQIIYNHDEPHGLTVGNEIFLAKCKESPEYWLFTGQEKRKGVQAIFYSVEKVEDAYQLTEYCRIDRPGYEAECHAIATGCKTHEARVYLGKAIAEAYLIHDESEPVDLDRMNADDAYMIYWQASSAHRSEARQLIEAIKNEYHAASAAHEAALTELQRKNPSRSTFATVEAWPTAERLTRAARRARAVGVPRN